jgi:Kef-type K+ transport system membrane component KefB
MTGSTLSSMVAIVGAGTLAPYLGDHLARWIRIPSVVLEIALGIVIGPALLGWAHEDTMISGVADFGLSMLMFMAGYEIDFQRVRGTPLRLAATGWVISTGLGLLAGLALHGPSFDGMVIGLALTTTALGTILPVVRDAGLLPTPFGGRILAVGAAGEFGPIVAMSLLLTSEHPVLTGFVIVGFVLLSAGAAWLAMRPRTPRLSRMVSATLGTSVQLAVRLTMFVVVLMLWLASALELDVLLGAFAAGLIIRLFLGASSTHEVEIVESKLEAIGYGFLVPFFFVVSGMRFDLKSLVSKPSALLLIPGCLLLFLLIRGLPTFLLHRRDLPAHQQQALALLASSALPLVVVITNIGVEDGRLAPSTAAAMVAAGMLSVLVYPLLALGRLRTGYDASSASNSSSVAPRRQ